MKSCSEVPSSRFQKSNLVLAIALAASPAGLTLAIPVEEARAAVDDSSIMPPPGLLTKFEERRHLSFVAAVRLRPIELLFLGDSSVEFWLQEGEGKAVWEANYASIPAANFGVQGASLPSVLWRLQNGELEGLKAKVIVFDGMWSVGANKKMPIDEMVAGNTAIIQELRRRQPQARILLTVVPRTRYPESPNRPIEAALTAEFSRLADGERIHFVDTRPHFLTEDGSLNTMVLSGRGNAMNADGYAKWAAAIEPKLAELMAGS